MPADVSLLSDQFFCVKFKELLNVEAFGRDTFKVEVLVQIFILIMDIADKFVHLVLLT